MSDYTDLIADARVWPRDGVSKGPLINALADAIEALVKERDELAAVVEKMHSVGERLSNSRGDEWVEIDAPEWDQVLSAAPADALREHDRLVAERAWEEGARWAAVEFGKDVSVDESRVGLVPSDNPYRKEQEAADA